jgi:hypothetical protein
MVVGNSMEAETICGLLRTEGIACHHAGVARGRRRLVHGNEQMRVRSRAGSRDASRRAVRAGGNVWLYASVMGEVANRFRRSCRGSKSGGREVRSRVRRRRRRRPSGSSIPALHSTQNDPERLPIDEREEAAEGDSDPVRPALGEGEKDLRSHAETHDQKEPQSHGPRGERRGFERLFLPGHGYGGFHHRQDGLNLRPCGYSFAASSLPDSSPCRSPHSSSPGWSKMEHACARPPRWAAGPHTARTSTHARAASTSSRDAPSGSE